MQFREVEFIALFVMRYTYVRVRTRSFFLISLRYSDRFWRSVKPVQTPRLFIADVTVISRTRMGISSNLRNKPVNERNKMAVF